MIKKPKMNENAAGATDVEMAEAKAGTASARLAELEQKNAELTSDLQRTRADFENYRKQVEQQKENEKQAARLGMVYKMLTMLDDLDRAVATYEELKPLEKSLAKTLEELGLTKIATEGEFDPDLHEAIQVEGEGDKEVIAETLRPGYYYEGGVLRPAMVKVTRI